MRRFRAKRDQPKRPVILDKEGAAGLNIFVGEWMTCAFCGRERKSDLAAMSNWRSVHLNGKRYDFCTAHFPPDDAGEEAFADAYRTVLEKVLRDRQEGK